MKKVITFFLFFMLLIAVVSNEARILTDIEGKYKQEKHTKSLEIISLDEEVEPQIFVNGVHEEIKNESNYIQADYLIELASVESSEEFEIEILNCDGILDTTKAYLIKDLMVENAQKSVIENETELTENLILENNYNSNNPIIVAVIDTGIDITNEIFKGKTVPGYDFINDTEIVYNEELGMEQAHGTHVAGIIAQTADNVKIMPLKVFENGKAHISDIIEAIKFAQDNGAMVVNCSWGSSNNNKALKETMENTDMLFVCAAGNNGVNLDKTKIYPGCFDLNNIINVTCINDDYKISGFSNYSSTHVDIAAKGIDIKSIAPGGKTLIMSGTSMSAAFVSAVVAEARQENPGHALKDYIDKVDFLCNDINEGKVLNYENIKSKIDRITIDAEKFEYKPYNNYSKQKSWGLFSSPDEPEEEKATITAFTEVNGKSITVSGQISNGKGHQVGIIVNNPNGEICHIDQQESGENGNYSITFELLDGAIDGTYAIRVGGTNVGDELTVTFEYKADIINHMFTVVEGNNYLIPVSVYNFSDFGRKFHILYDTSVFDVVNISLQNSMPITSVGNYDKINVLSVLDGDIEFEFTYDIGSENAWNGLLNIIELKAKTSKETTVICYSE